MYDLSHNIKTICVLLILVLTILGGTTAVQAATTTAASTTVAAASATTNTPSFSAPTAHTASAAPKILITEIFPNPKGKDENKEWIELFNAGNEQVNLDGWQISQTTTGKKKSENFYIGNLKINAKSYTLISGKNFKKPLKNKENTIALLTPSSEVVVKIYYKASEEEKSFSLIKIINMINTPQSSIIATTAKTKYVWRWTSPSKGEKNKDFYYLKGKIASANDKTFTLLINQNSLPKPKNLPKSLPAGQASLPGQTPDKTKWFDILIIQRKKLTIHYKNINTLLLKIFSKQKTTLTILASKENNKLILIKIINAR